MSANLAMLAQLRHQRNQVFSEYRGKVGTALESAAKVNLDAIDRRIHALQHMIATSQRRKPG